MSNLFSKQKMSIVLSGLIFILLVSAGYWWIKSKSATTNKPIGQSASQAKLVDVATSSNQQNSANPGFSIDGSGRKTHPTNQDIQQNQALYIPEAADDDHDGLPNNLELKIGTDPEKADTDGDGLSDYQETMVYFTDPLNPDTDGDGFTDGAEVKAGFNPKGPGKLELPIKPGIVKFDKASGKWADGQ